MPLIVGNARSHVKLTRDILVEGAPKQTGDVVEVDHNTKNRLLTMGAAVEHDPAGKGKAGK